MEAPVRFALSACLTAGIVGWLGPIDAGAQGTVTLPTAVPPNVAPGTTFAQPTVVTPGTVVAPGSAVAPGTLVAPGQFYAPGSVVVPATPCPPGATCAPSGITTWDPYAMPQATIIQENPCPPCPQPMLTPCAPKTYRFGIFGEYLFWRAGDSTTTDYAVPINGGIVPPPEPTIPVGPIATLNMDYESGFRIGGWWQRTCESQVAVTYTL
jgi:hypothetical protein